MDFLCDAMWQQIGEEYDDIKVISPDHLKELSDVFVIVFSGNLRNWNLISGMLASMQIPYVHVDNLIGTGRISGKELKGMGGEVYCDERNNRIEFYQDIEDSITVTFLGGGSRGRIGRHVSTEKLDICCGSNAVCTIGEGTEIEEAQFF